MSAGLRQKTIASAVSLSGVGLHTGRESSVTLRPASPGAGIRFFQRGRRLETSVVDPTVRCTSVGDGQTTILTVEHLLAALGGLGVANVEIDVDGTEIPALDGSAAPFVKVLKETGLVDQRVDREAFKIREPIFCHEPGKALAIYPADDFSVSYVLDYDHPRLRNQKIDLALTPEVFEREIAPARTFCTEEEAGRVRSQGLGLGADRENTLVISEKGPTHGALRFPDECARHKVLDLVGDLNLLGFPVLGRVVGLRSGHSLNRKLVEAIKKQRESTNMEKDRVKSVSHPIEFEEIKKILPHRYPFLLVDRILETSDQHVTGIKNVTGNEPFFQGHFPGKPVMPAVLMVEALAQLGGVMMLRKTEHHGKLAYLVGIHNAHFRKIVVPGDQLVLRADLVKVKSKIGLMKASATVDGVKACDAEILFTLI